MITQKTACAIVVAYEEITAGEKLLAAMEELKKDYKPIELRNAFGDRRGLQLGVPHGESGHRLLDVKPELAMAVITAHISDRKALLMALNESAKMESDEMVAKRAIAALQVARKYGGIDGKHHKEWVIDQMCRILAGTGYEAFVMDVQKGKDGQVAYEWRIGVAP